MKFLKGFLLFAAACLMLAASWNLIGGKFSQVREAKADFDHSGLIIGFDPAPEALLNATMLLSDGSAVTFDGSLGSNFTTPQDQRLPVAPGDIKFWSRSHIVSTSDELWVVFNGEWTNYGRPPGGPVGSESDSISSLKSRVRGDQ